MSEEMQELQEELSNLRKLTESMGWPWLVDQASEIVQNRFDALLSLSSEEISMETLPGIIFKLAEMKAVNNFINLVPARQEILRAEIDAKLKAARGEDDD